MGEVAAARGNDGAHHEFEPRPGGAYRMALNYSNSDQSNRGKTSEDKNIVEGRFLELVPDEQVVHVVTFVSDNPAFAGEMKMSCTFRQLPAEQR
jgi:uncharacterized protein YndB with AHSA1/START domain